VEQGAGFCYIIGVAIQQKVDSFKCNCFYEYGHNLLFSVFKLRSLLDSLGACIM